MLFRVRIAHSCADDGDERNATIEFEVQVAEYVRDRSESGMMREWGRPGKG